MTYFPHTEDHEIDCNCSFCLDVDPNKSIASELERVIEKIMQETLPKLDEGDFRKVSDELMRLDVLCKYVPTQELPAKFEKQVADAIKKFNEE